MRQERQMPCGAKISWSEIEGSEFFSLPPPDKRMVVIRIDCLCLRYSMARTTGFDGWEEVATEILRTFCSRWGRQQSPNNVLPANWHPELGRPGRFSAKRSKPPAS